MCIVSLMYCSCWYTFLLFFECALVTFTFTVLPGCVYVFALWYLEFNFNFFYLRCMCFSLSLTNFWPISVLGLVDYCLAIWGTWLDWGSKWVFIKSLSGKKHGYLMLRWNAWGIGAACSKIGLKIELYILTNPLLLLLTLLPYPVIAIDSIYISKFSWNLVCPVVCWTMRLMRSKWKCHCVDSHKSMLFLLASESHSTDFSSYFLKPLKMIMHYRIHQFPQVCSLCTILWYIWKGEIN